MRKFSLILIFCLNVFGAEYKIYVEGMHCVLCTSLIRKELLKVDGVESAKASLKSKTAVIKCVDETDKQNLLKAVQNAGYEGAFVE